jgi:NhaA family Na+:H+ antiporter
LLAGIGFTVSIFIAALAFDDAAMIAEAKIGVLSASIIAGIAGYAALRLLTNNRGVGE